MYRVYLLPEWREFGIGRGFCALADLPGHWIDAVHDRRPPKSITLDSADGWEDVLRPVLRALFGQCPAVDHRAAVRLMRPLPGKTRPLQRILALLDVCCSTVPRSL
jgi:hypothetical protein